MVKKTNMAATLALCGGWQAAKVFVPLASGPAVRSDASAVRGAISAGRSAAGSSSSNLQISMVGMSGVCVVAAIAKQGGRSNKSRTERKAAATLDSESVPPPPPPFDPAAQVGVTEPLGFFDPLGFSKSGDEEGFRKLRAAERKHGRVAMMAAVGAVAQHFVQFPGFQDVPKGLAALTTVPGVAGFAVLVAASGALEMTVWKDNAEGEPGDFGNPLNLERLPTGEPVDIGVGPRNRELNNGRMAMISILGIMAAELATGKDAVEQFM